MSIPGAASPLFLGAAVAEEAAYQIDRSLRFNDDDSAHLNKTFSSAGNRKKWTWSGWVKRSNLSSSTSDVKSIFAAYTDSSNRDVLRFTDDNGANIITFQVTTSGTSKTEYTSAVFRDVSAWMHVVLAFDSGQSTASDRVKIYVNGVSQTLSGTAVAQDTQSSINSNVAHYLGARSSSGSAELFYDGYLADVHFIDGQALAPTDFGEYDSNNNWNPKAYSGTYGTNGFHLDFSDNSSDNALGYDATATTPTLNPRGGFDAVKWTGNGSTQTISGLAFQPDFVWTSVVNKTGYNKYLVDVVRGSTKVIISHKTDAESTQSSGVTSFTPDGFTLGSDAQVNESSTNYVAWCWKAGGPVELNEDGSIDSQVSVSTDYGFSVITYTGTGSAGATVGHGLGSVPKFILVKNRSGTDVMVAYHASVGNTGALRLTTAATDTGYNWWNSTTPSSSVFTIGNTGATNNSSSNYVAYCWSEVSGFSKFGSYSGNGQTLGPTVTTGFKPRLVAVKRTDSTGNWTVYDSARNLDKDLKWNTNEAEGTAPIIFNSDGFQINYVTSSVNVSGGSYVYMAFADRPGNNWTPNNLIAEAGLETASQGFDVVTYSGNGSTQSISSLAFQPDFVWIKCRNDSVGHQLFDQVRGAGKSLLSNTTDAERTNHIYGYLSAFTSDGFTVTAGSSDDFEVNGSAETYVAWCWNAGANSNKTYTVKVVSDSGNKYRFDDFGTSAVTLDLAEGSTYVFDQSDSSNAGHPIRFGTSANGTDYTTGVTHTGTPGSAGAKTTLVLGTGVATLYYSCANHSGMGGQINTNSTAGASNFDGSIQAITKADTTYGFSIATYTGTEGGTFGHGLNSPPQFVIVKRLNSSAAWTVWHKSISNTKYLMLDSDAALNTYNVWGNTSPNSSVVTVSGDSYTGNNGDDYVAYCWSEVPGFSKFGSYEGNGSTTGPVVTLGFKPRFVMFKRTDASSSWRIHDTARHPSNPLDSLLFPNENSAETTNSAYNVDFLDDGFQIKNNNSNFNTNGGDYIYMAFADKPPGEIIDSLIDTPTNYEASSGNNGGNYATLNPLSKGSLMTLANGNLDISAGTGSGSQRVWGTIGVSTGKWYFEFTQSSGTYAQAVGIKSSAAQDNSTQYGYHGNTGNKIDASGSTSSYGATWGNNDVIGVAFDLDAGTITFYKNGVSQGQAFSGITDATYFPYVFGWSGGAFGGFVNFGQRPFAYTPPTGFLPLVTTNLPDPTIADGSTAFDVRSGLTSQFTISDLNFAADLVVAKSTSHSEYWIVADVLRNFIGGLRWNDTNQEGSGNAITNVGATGYQSDSNWFTTGRTYATFNWDAGTTTATNTDGSITSNVRVNQSAGFSIVTYEADAPNNVIGHGLNAEPYFVITKARDRTDNWLVYHYDLGVDKWLHLNLSSAPVTTSGIWGTASNWTNSTFGVSTNSIEGNNYGSHDYVAYCWAPVSGYSSFGQYTGNGSSDGPFVYTGHRSRFLLIKANIAGEDWVVIDTERETYNTVDSVLFANDPTQEITNSAYNTDILSNGFKLRGTNPRFNTSGETYVFASFAEHPFKTARAR